MKLLIPLTLLLLLIPSCASTPSRCECDITYAGQARDANDILIWALGNCEDADCIFSELTRHFEFMNRAADEYGRCLQGKIQSP